MNGVTRAALAANGNWSVAGDSIVGSAGTGTVYAGGITGTRTALNAAGLSNYYSTEVNPRYLLSRDATASGQSGLVMNNDGTQTFAANGVGISSVANRALGIFTSNGTALSERVRVDAGGNVGIGTTTPRTALDINAVGAAPSLSADTGVLSVTPDAGSMLAFGSYPTSPFASWIQTKRRANDGTSWPLTINPLGGNVGIGTSNPLSPLQIRTASFSVSANNTEGADAGYGVGGIGFNLVRSGSSNAWSLATDGANNGGAMIDSNVGGQLRFFTVPNSGTTVQNLTTTQVLSSMRMLIDNIGRVGIGTTSPSALLHVNGGVRSEFNFNAGGAAGNGYGYYFGTDGSTGVLGNTTPSNIAIRTGSATRMTIDANGNVGIGTTAPAANLHISGTSSVAAPNLRMNDPSFARMSFAKAGVDQWTLGGDNSAFHIYDYTSGVNRLTVLPSGNVGIGTTVPAYLLELRGTTSSTLGVGAVTSVDAAIEVGANATGSHNSYIDLTGDTTYSDYGLRLIRNGGANGASSVATRGTGGLIFNNNEAGPYTFQQAGSEKLRIDTAGNVGIGTTNPSSPLAVQTSSLGAGVGTVVQAQRSTNGNGLELWHSTYASGASLAASVFNNGSASISSPVALSLQAQNSNIYLDGTKVNITKNRTGADTMLQIGTSGGVGAVGDTVGIVFQSIGSGGGVNNTAQISSVVEGASGAVSGLSFFTTSTQNSPTERLRIASSGNVGIGSTAPGGKLDINQPAAGSTAVQSVNAGTTFWKIVNPAGGATNTWNTANAVEYVGRDTGTNRSINAAGTVNSSGADFAEWVDWNGKKPEMGSIILYRGSYVVVSSPFTAAFVGNDVKDPEHAILIAFAGQLPVLVRGAVNEGDLIVANGDGTGRAVRRDQLRTDEAGKTVGTAWQASNNASLKRINIAVGIGLSGQSAREIEDLRRENADIKARLEKIELLLKTK